MAVESSALGVEKAPATLWHRARSTDADSPQPSHFWSCLALDNLLSTRRSLQLSLSGCAVLHEEMVNALREKVDTEYEKGAGDAFAAMES